MDTQSDEVREGNSRLVTVFGTFGDICWLNVLWLITSIPIFTIGASTTAIYSVMLKIIDKKEGKITKSYFDAFKSNFKQATIEWLIVLVALVAIAGEVYFAYALEFTGTIAAFYFMLAIVELVVVVVDLPFLFPLTAKFENTVWNTLKNSFLLAVSNPLSWVKIFLAWFMPFFICIWYQWVFLLIWYLWLICIIGLIVFGTSYTVRKVLRKISTAQEEKEEEVKET